MFTGIIEELGIVKSIKTSTNNAFLQIGARYVNIDTKIGDSIAVNGACLTVIDCKGEEISFDVSDETLTRTTISMLKKGDKVNLERALKSTDRLGGHFVSGHIDQVGIIKEKIDKTDNLELKIEVNNDIAQYIVSKGSICIDGVSLTVAGIQDNLFTVAIIPHTKKNTTLGYMTNNDKVNIEVDILGKYIHKCILGESGKNKDITKNFLKEMGFI